MPKVSAFHQEPSKSFSTSLTFPATVDPYQALRATSTCYAAGQRDRLQEQHFSTHGLPSKDVFTERRRSPEQKGHTDHGRRGGHPLPTGTEPRQRRAGGPDAPTLRGGGRQSGWARAGGEGSPGTASGPVSPARATTRPASSSRQKSLQALPVGGSTVAQLPTERLHSHDGGRCTNTRRSPQPMPAEKGIRGQGQPADSGIPNREQW